LSEFKTTLNANDIDAPANTQTAEASTQEPATPSTIHDLGNLDLDLDLDFSLDEPQLTEHTGAGELSDPPEIPHALVAEMTADATAPTNEDSPATLDDLPTAFAMDTSITPIEPTQPPAPALDANANSESDADLDFDLDLEDPTSQPAPLDTPPKTEPATLAADLQGDTGAMAFDLGDLSLDFSSTKAGDLPNLGDMAEPSAAEQAALDNPETQPGGYADVDGDPLETKLALADEFKAIGDEDGARALIEEVMAEASGEVKERAERALKKL
jgi:pilus assembly protein FimV